VSESTLKGAVAEAAITAAAVLWLPIEKVAGRRTFSLRLMPAANNQRAAINFAGEYELGAIAQLGERLHGMQEVVGSSPTSSTPSRPS
jgi:hypothetical protein